MKTLDYLHLDENAAGKLVQSLQQLLADFQVHYMNLRGFHWNIQGHGFFVLHSKFEEMYDDMAEKIDQIAERILMLRRRKISCTAIMNISAGCRKQRTG